MSSGNTNLLQTGHLIPVSIRGNSTGFSNYTLQIGDHHLMATPQMVRVLTIEGPNVRWKRGGRVDTAYPIGGCGGSGQGDALGDIATGH